MRKTFTLLVFGLALGGLAFGQGAGGSGIGKGGQALRDQLKNSVLSGAGGIQKDFFNSLQGGLKDQFGDKTGGKLFGNLQNQSLDPKQVTNLMNGKTTKSQVQDLFGASRGQIGGTQKALEGAVGDKNEKLFFGMMVIVMVFDFDVDPDGEFCKQCCAAREEMDDEHFEKLLKGNVSTKTIEKAFGFDHKEDQKFMQDILTRMQESPFTTHPMCESLGMNRNKREFDPSQFPKPEDGMSGFGDEFEGGMAGGFPFDQEMPPCPFAGGNADQWFPGGEEDGDTPDDGTPEGGGDGEGGED